MKKCSNFNLHTYNLLIYPSPHPLHLSATLSYIILFIDLFSLCLTALYSCRTGERNMEISMAVTGDLQLFDARSSAARLGVV